MKKILFLCGLTALTMVFMLLIYQWFPMINVELHDGNVPPTEELQDEQIIHKTESTLGWDNKEGVDLVYLFFDRMSRIHYKDWPHYFESPEKIQQMKYLGHYRENNYIRYFMRMVWFHMPWIRNIHIVISDYRDPSDINIKHPNVFLTRHSDLLKKRDLPNFNWRALAANVHKISNLSENFILMPDTLFPYDKVELSDFLQGPLGSRKIFTSTKMPDALPEEEKEVVENSKRFVLDRLLYRDPVSRQEALKLEFETRVPMLMNKNVMGELHSLFDDVLDTTQQHRFRANTTFDIIQMYQYYTYIQVQNASFEKAWPHWDLDKPLETKDLKVLEEQLQMQIPSNYSNLPFKELLNVTEIRDTARNFASKKEYRYVFAELNEMILEGKDMHQTLNHLNQIDHYNPKFLYLGSKVLLSSSSRHLSFLETFLRNRITEPSPYEVEGVETGNYALYMFIFVLGGVMAILGIGTKFITR